MDVRTLSEEEFYGRGVGKYLYYKAYYPPNPAHDTLITYRINVDSSDSRIKGYEWGNIIHVVVTGYSIEKAWDGVNWMNPPYKNMKKFIKKAYDERDNAVTVCLIPARTNTIWWHEYCMSGQIIFICGRPKFKGCVHGLPQPLALVVFGRKNGRLGSFDLMSNSLVWRL